jgi:hypothetical protein
MSGLLYDCYLARDWFYVESWLRVLYKAKKHHAEQSNKNTSNNECVSHGVS